MTWTPGVPTELGEYWIMTFGNVEHWIISEYEEILWAKVEDLNDPIELECLVCDSLGEARILGRLSRPAWPAAV